MSDCSILPEIFKRRRNEDRLEGKLTREGNIAQEGYVWDLISLS